MRALQYIGYVVALFGAAAACLGGVLAATGRDMTQAAGQLWYALDSTSLNTVQAVVQRYVHPGLWDNVIVPLLLRPAWEALTFLAVVSLTVGIALIAVARTRRRNRRRLMSRGL